MLQLAAEPDNVREACDDELLTLQHLHGTAVLHYIQRNVYKTSIAAH